MDTNPYRHRLIRFYKLYGLRDRILSVSVTTAKGKGAAALDELVTVHGAEPIPEDFPTRLRRMYTRYAPAKIDTIPSALAAAASTMIKNGDTGLMT